MTAAQRAPVAPLSRQRGHDRGSVDDELRRIWQIAVDREATLPGEHALASELGISRPRVREHLARLEHEGLIRRRRGADTVVNVAASDIDVRFDMQIDYAKMLRAAGHEVSVEVLAASRRRLDSSEVAFFGVWQEWMAICVLKRWRADGEVFMLADDVLAVPPAVTLDSIELSAEIAVLAEIVRGTPVEWTIAVPGAIALDDVATTHLERPAGSVALSLEIVGVGRSGERFFRAQELHVPGRMRFGFIRSRATQT